jgi:hypothetical protein
MSETAWRTTSGAETAASSETTALNKPSKTTEDRGWIEFRDQCRRQMQRPIEQRIKYGFCRMYKPVLDDAPWRAFDTTKEYRAWCAAHLPDYLGFKPAQT